MPDDVSEHWLRLATFVHISDLHIGGLDPVSGDAEVSAAGARVYGTVSWFDGLLGHHGAALEELEALCVSLKANAEDVKVIVTGDLTRTGGYYEFNNAKQFLLGSLDLNPPNLRLTGLGLGQLDLVIPGNHDHWGDSFVALGAGPSEYKNYFSGPMPCVHPPFQLANGRELQFVSINSDADVSALSHNRQLALGKFVSEFAHQAAQFSRPIQAHEIRMMLIHHSWDQAGNILRMRTKSKDALGAYLTANGIKGILTGHSHEALLDFFTVQPSGTAVAELRAGSASQLDEVPPTWKSVWGTLPTRNWGANSVLVHRLYDDRSGGTHWHAQVYLRNSINGFQPMTGVGSTLLFSV